MFNEAFPHLSFSSSSPYLHGDPPAPQRVHGADHGVRHARAVAGVGGLRHRRGVRPGVRLEHELAAALEQSGTGECAGAEIDQSHLNLHLEAIADPGPALEVTKGVLARAGVIGRAVVALETRCPTD